MLDIQPRADLTVADGSGFFTYPLVFQAHLGEGDEVQVTITYDTGLLEEAEVANLGYQFEAVIQQLTSSFDDPEIKVGDIHAVSANDLTQLQAWNNAATPELVEQCIHDLFVKQVELRPHAPAISAWDASFTYAELDQAANRLANYLVPRFPALGPDVLVPICFEKSAWVFVAMLAVNKAGGAWVTLDPSHPQQRHKSIVEQTRTCVVLCSPAQAKRAFSLHADVVEVSAELDNALMATFGRDPPCPVSGVGPHHAVYVLFTSGSTGLPKDGTMTFVSRNNTQVKVRGFRIELSEIEHHVRVKLGESATSANEPLQIAVDTFKNKAGAVTLAAYICFSENTRVIPAGVDDIGELANELLQPFDENNKDGDNLRVRMLSLSSSLGVVLPPYMIPSVFITMRSMPLVTSQKINRIVLSRIASVLDDNQLAMYSLQDGTQERQAPQTETEIKLAGLWADILKVAPDAVGRESHFLRLGGDSIAAIRLVTAARDLGLELSVKEVFDDPRLLAIAATADAKGAADDGVDDWAGEYPEYVEPFALLQPESLGDNIASEDDIKQLFADKCRVSPDVVQDAYPCTALQDGLMVLANRQPESYTTRNVFKLPNGIHIDHFRQSWESVVESCDTLRTRIVVCNGHAVQVVLQEPTCWREPVPGGGIKAFVQREASTPIRYGEPLSRYGIVEDGGRVYFIWTVHHSVYDGWFLGQLFNMLDKFMSGEHHLVNKPVPFRNYIGYILACGEEDSRDFWREELDNTQMKHFPTPSSKKTAETKAPKIHQAICHQFQHVVAQLVGCAGELSVQNVPLFGSYDQYLISEWNAASNTEAIQSATIQQVFSEVVGKNPEAEAVYSFDGRFTYAELNAASDRLAGHLIALGVLPGMQVPLCFGHTAWYIVAVLAVLKAGAAFVPLHPQHPLRRRREVIEQLTSTILLGTFSGIESSAELASTMILVIVDAELDQRLQRCPPPQVTDWNAICTPGDAAYVIFTSGSTGTPKGVVLQQEAPTTCAPPTPKTPAPAPACS
ncbi:uncharacterized protein PgNI_08011 [Pyricularia grisea]|uniref:Carrier domain-containing protein n=1 Tax=Pyricularia grisea TaxID=148305 RepID=A0A6P8AWK5_PYRGI|nr:uncharacterized protein PgNI_08011 [Pyricularia grisea]TLD06603.1 hypothetical protein PgNI_08011 [Pyricularia grisea]